MALTAETGQAMLAREQLLDRAVMIRGEPVPSSGQPLRFENNAVTTAGW